MVPVAFVVGLAGCQLIGGFEDFSETKGGAGASGEAGAFGQGGSSGSGANKGGAGGKGGVGGSGGTGGSSGAGKGGSGAAPATGGGAGSDNQGTGGSSGSVTSGGSAGKAMTAGSSGSTASGGSAGEEMTAGSSGEGAGGASGDGGMPMPRCGDGIVQSNEICDDANTLACGHCSADCLTPIQAAKATGVIEVTIYLPMYLVDGNIFTLDDGVNPPVVFEFDKNNQFAAGRVRVAYVDADDQAALRLKVTAAIMGVDAALNIDAEIRQAADLIYLTNTYATALGNRPMSTTVPNSDSAFRMLGANGNPGVMEGGLAGDCSNGTGCTVPLDCAPGLTCEGDTCVPGN